MARFKEQNVDIIIEKDAFNIFLKDLRDELEISKVFVIATSSLDQDKLNHVIAVSYTHLTLPTIYSV